MGKGYHGILCGACDESHGKERSGKCQTCRSKGANITIAVAVAIAGITFAIVSMMSAFSAGRRSTKGHTTPRQGGATQDYTAEVSKVPSALDIFVSGNVHGFKGSTLPYVTWNMTICECANNELLIELLL